MTKEAKVIYDILLKCEKESNNKNIQGFLSVFPEDMRCSIIDLFEELTYEDRICGYTIFTGREWTCNMK